MIILPVAIHSHAKQDNANYKLSEQVNILQQENAVLIKAVNSTSQALVIERERTPSVVSCANSQKDYIRTLRNTELKYNMPKGLLTYVAYLESNFNPNAVSHKGAVGIMQIVPRWHPEVNARDPYDAIPYSAKYLTYLKKRFGSWELALAAWNWGEGNMSKYSFYDAPRETRNFVKKIIAKVLT
jgi:soluble lytic murein transglycosylase-like protein